MKPIPILSIMLCVTLYACNSGKSKEKTATEVSITQTTSEETSDKKVTDKTSKNRIKVTPIFHGTLLLEYENTVFYIDPVNGAKAFEGQKSPNFILITDIHGDHLNVETLQAIVLPSTKIVAPSAVADKLPENLRNQTSVLANFETKDFTSGDVTFSIEGIPMYNLREEALQFHPKHRGNGYVLSLGDERVYVSGDTEDIPEMRNLEQIDIAFVCMNLPYTMTVESAADAVLDFKPKKVYPYHYRGTNGFSDVKKFKTLINSENSTIQVIQDDWYKKSDKV